MAVIEGDPFGNVKEPVGSGTPTPREVNLFHDRDDVDSSWNAHHHTIGIKHNQVSAGDHVHDGRSSRKIGDGLQLSVNGAIGGNAALDSLIEMLKQVVEFTDNTTP